MGLQLNVPIISSIQHVILVQSQQENLTKEILELMKSKTSRYLCVYIQT